MCHSFVVVVVVVGKHITQCNIQGQKCGILYTIKQNTIHKNFEKITS